MKVRMVNTDDFDSLYIFFERNGYFNTKLDFAHFVQLMNWLYQSNLWGKNYQFLMEKKGSQNSICAHHGLTPFKININKKSFIGGLASNLLVDLNERNGLVFLNLQRQFFRNFNQHGFDFVFGLVNKKDVLKTHLKTGYRKILDVPIYVKPCSLISIGSLTLGNWAKPFGYIAQKFFDAIFYKKLNKYIYREISKFDEKVNKLTASFFENWFVYSERNSEILNWRFTNLTFRNYKIYYVYDQKDLKLKGYIVLRQLPMKQFNAMAIVDLVWDLDDKNVLNDMLNFATEFAKESNCDFLSIFFNSDKLLKYKLYSNGFIKSPEYFTLVDNSPKTQDLFAPIIEQLNQKNYNWYLTWFDHDYV
jgi:hypothetical protein